MRFLKRFVVVVGLQLLFLLPAHDAFQLAARRGRWLTMRTQGNKRRLENKGKEKQNSPLGNSVPFSSSSSSSSRIQFDSSSPTSAFLSRLRQRSHDDEKFDFDREERQALAQALEHFLPRMSKAEVVLAVVSLGTCSQSKKQWRAMPGNPSPQDKALFRALDRVSADFSSQDLAAVLVAAARMDWQWDVAFTTTSSLRPTTTTTSTSTSTFAETAPSSMSALLESLLPSCTDQHVSDIFWGLGSVNFRLRQHASASTQKALLKSFEEKAGRLSGYSLSSALWALAKMGAQWSDLSPQTRSMLPSRLLALSSSQDGGQGMSPQQSSKVIWSLGTCGMRFQPSLSPLLDFLVAQVGTIKRSQMGGAVPASQTLVGLAKMGVAWDLLSAVAKEGVLEQVVRVCQSTNDRGITSAVWALGTMSVPAGSLTPEVRDIVFAGVTRAAETCNAWALCNIVWGMAKMRFDWLLLPVSFRQMLMANVIRLEPDMNSQDASILIWSLGAIDTPLDALPPLFTERLLRAAQRTMDKMKPEELSRVIWGLSSAELAWDSLPPGVQWNLNVNLRRVGEAMAPQDLANCAYGLAILAFDTKEPSDPAFRGAHEALLNTIADNRDKILQRLRDDPASCAMQGQELEQIRIFSHYLATMGFVSDTKRIPNEFLVRSGSTAAAAAAVGESAGGGGGGGGTGSNRSRLQSRVTKGLVNGLAALSAAPHPDDSSDSHHHRIHPPLEVNPEVSCFGGVFPVDAGVSQNDETIALIEIDGPHHYRPCDGRLRRKDQLKETMYRTAMPECAFHRVRWDDANKVGSDVVGEEIAELVLADARARTKKGGFEGFYRNVLRDAGTFFAWGLRNEK